MSRSRLLILRFKKPGMAVDLDDMVNEYSRRMNLVGRERADRHEFLGLRNHHFCCSCHNRIEVSHGISVREIAETISASGLQKGEVRAQRRLEHILASINNTDFLTYREFSRDGGSGIKAAKTGAGRPDALDQCPLWH